MYEFIKQLKVRRNKIDSVLRCGARGIIIFQKQIMLMNKTNLDNISIKFNPFFKEHISGAGWHNVKNQTGSCFDFGVVRGITDTIGLRATTNNYASMFYSKNAINWLLNNKGKKFSDGLHCEHLIPINQIRCDSWKAFYIFKTIKTPSQLAKFIVQRQIVCTITNKEKKTLNNFSIVDNYPFKKYNFDIFYFDNETNKFKNASNLTIQNVLSLYDKNIYFNNIIRGLSEVTNEENDVALNIAKEYLEDNIRYYHKIPKDEDMLIFTKSLYELEEKHYTHKPHKKTYTG